jgi:hypothetical protein
MSDYRIEAATKEEWAIRALNAEERNKELTLQLLATCGQAADALDKLNKAVEALREFKDFDDMPTSHKRPDVFELRVRRKLLTTLAELEGRE